MATGELTISDLVECASPPNESVRSVWLRRGRYYAQAGLLDTAGPLHAGSGRHRRFPQEAAFLAALLFRLGSAGLPLPVLTAVADTVKGHLKDPSSSPFKDAWEAAKDGQDAHIGIMFADPEATADGVPSFVQLDVLGGEKVPSLWVGPIPLHVVNLGRIFGAVRAGTTRAPATPQLRPVRVG